MDRLSPKVSLIIFFTIFFVLGLLTFLSHPQMFATSNPPNFQEPLTLENFKNSNPSKNKYCLKEGYIETHYSDFNSRFFAPLLGVFYGTICDKSILFLINVPYFLFLAIICNWLYRNVPLDKLGESKLKKAKSGQ